MILGIDEAGRGAVLGPLVLAGVAFSKSNVLIKLSLAGLRDSKLLSRAKRAQLANDIIKLRAAHSIIRISPRALDKKSINQLEADRSATIINKLKPTVAYLDVPASGAGIARYCQMVEKKCRHKTNIVGGNKMESQSVAVAAASVIAKEERERQVRRLHKIYGDFGSGYPADPKTISWIATWAASGKPWPPIVRQKWGTISNMEKS